MSETRPVNCGVPQRSILSPVLFILHTNNIPRVTKGSSEDSTVAAYADDTQTVDQFSKPQLQEQLAKTSENIAHTQDSYAQIGLKMNPSTTQCILYRPRQVLAGIRRDLEPEINGQGEGLALENVVKDLGVLLDDKMTFAAHANSLVQKMTGTLCYLPRICYFLREDAAKLLVHAHVLNRLDYCPVVWGALDRTMIQKLQETVSFAARVILRAKKYDHVTPPSQAAKLFICGEQTEGGNGMFYVQGNK